MKSLFWKEWRENRANLLIGVLFVVGVSFIMLLFGSPPEFLPESFIIWIFAGFFGAWSFSKEKGKLDFLLSLPTQRKTIFLGKWLFGILNILILLVIALAMEKLIYETNGFNLLTQPIKKGIYTSLEGSYLLRVDERLLQFLPTFLSFYNITFFLSLLLADVVPILVMGWIISIIVSLPLNLLFSHHRLGLNLTLVWNGTTHIIFSLIVLFIAYRIFSRKEAKT